MSRRLSEPLCSHEADEVEAQWQEVGYSKPVPPASHSVLLNVWLRLYLQENSDAKVKLHVEWYATFGARCMAQCLVSFRPVQHPGGLTNEIAPIASLWTIAQESERHLKLGVPV